MPETKNVSGEYRIKVNGSSVFLLTSSTLELAKLDNTPIGSTTPATGAFTTLSTTGLATFLATLRVNATSIEQTDANGLTLNSSNGSGQILFRIGGAQQGRIGPVGTAVNYFDFSGSATGAAVPLGVAGTDDNIDVAVTPKGTGIVTSAAAIRALSGTAIPAGGTAGAGFRFSSTANFGVFFGSGAPTLAAAQGSLYLRSDGSSTSTRAYINTDGSTTWTNITTAA